MTYELEQFLPLVYIGIALLAAAVTFESISFVVKRAIRRHFICARRNCAYGHTWGRSFHYVHGGSPYIGKRCLRCPQTEATSQYSYQGTAYVESEKLKLTNSGRPTHHGNQTMGS